MSSEPDHDVPASDADPEVSPPSPGESRDAATATSEPQPPLRTRPFLLGLFLVTAIGLALEVLITRLLSVITWYSLAFLVIAMGLFGLTAGAIRVYLAGARYARERLPEELSRESRKLAFAILISYVLMLVMPLRTDASLTTVFLFVAFAATIALPFYPAGVLVAACLTRAELPIGRVYAVDLLGAALGAPLIPLLLHFADAGSAALMLAALAALAGAFFARSGAPRRQFVRSLWLALGFVAFSGCNQLTDRGLKPLWVKGRPELREGIQQELWNSHSRVVVFHPLKAPAGLWGAGNKCSAPLVLQTGIEIDGHAATPLYHTGGDLESLRFLDCDVTNAVHAIRPHGQQAVIGVGGSRDIQAAVLAGHSPVIGIELNDRLIQLLRGPLGEPTGISQRHDVGLAHDDARSYLARTKRRFSVIQMSLIDTWAATGAGAHALGENGLYTLDAWRIFLDRLEPGGVFTVSRWATVETARLLALATGALLSRGVDNPREHIALLAGGLVTTLIVGRDPLSAADQTKLRALADAKGFLVLALPGQPMTAERLEQVLDAKNLDELNRVTLLPELDFRPPTDDRPFFFNVIRVRGLFAPLPEVTKGTIEGNLLATRTLGLAFIASLILVSLGIVIPLMRRARPKGHTGRGLGAAFGYFAAIGVGFMLAEVALLQRLSLVLGHPSYSLLVVLSSLVGAAGLGSLLSDRLPLTRRPACYVLPVALAGLLVLVALLLPRLAPVFEPLSTASRVGFAIGTCLITGLGLGMAFPTGMRLASRIHADETPWFWGINGMGSVLASSVAIMIALSWGLTSVLFVAAGCYLLLVPCVRGLLNAADEA